jgi:hypothetical protein
MISSSWVIRLVSSDIGLSLPQPAIFHALSKSEIGRKVNRFESRMTIRKSEPFGY